MSKLNYSTVLEVGNAEIGLCINGISKEFHRIQKTYYITANEGDFLSLTSEQEFAVKTNMLVHGDRWIAEIGSKFELSDDGETVEVIIIANIRETAKLMP